MNAKTFNPIEMWSNPAADAFKFWASLWPTAPLFGVEWRFADAVGQFSPLTGKSVTAKPTAKKAPKKAPTPKAASPKAASPKAVAAPEFAAPELATPAAPAAVEPAPVTGKVAATSAATSAEPMVPASLMVAAPKKADDLTVIKGVGPALARQLNGLGVYKFSQIAGFSDEDLAWIDMNLPAPRGRCFRDDWAGQAKALLG